jgi:hypothetical protein
MPDGFSWPAVAEVCEAKRPGWLPFLSIGQSLLQCWYFIMSSLEPQPIQKLKMKIITKADRNPSAGYELIAI